MKLRFVDRSEGKPEEKAGASDAEEATVSRKQKPAIAMRKKPPPPGNKNRQRRLVKERNRGEFKGEHQGVRRHASLERSHNHNRSIEADYESENMQTDLEQRKQKQGKRETLI
ncbi:hypothetical protein Bca101_097445 [Brassica carinata]